MKNHISTSDTPEIPDNTAPCLSQSAGGHIAASCALRQPAKAGGEVEEEGSSGLRDRPFSRPSHRWSPGRPWISQ